MADNARNPKLDMVDEVYASARKRGLTDADAWKATEAAERQPSPPPPTPASLFSRIATMDES